MNRLTQSTLVVLVGFIAGTATLNGLFLNFVKPGLKWPLLIASALLVAMGAYGVVVESAREEHIGQGGDHPRPEGGEDSHLEGGEDPHPGAEGGPVDHGAAHSHAGGSRVGWLLIVPFMLLGVVVPPPLGAFSAQQDSGLVSGVQSAEGLPELAPSTGPLQMSLSEYSARALYDERKPLQDRMVRLTGFASGSEGAEGWALTRMALNCCAADGYAIKVDVQGGEKLPDNTWVEVVGTWVPTPPSADPQRPGLPIVRIETMTRIPKPQNPYE